ncbi:MAG: glucosaminidase domain-containing protein [Pseudomonadota bacterium]
MSAITDFSQFASLRVDATRADASANNAALNTVAEQFEALFVQRMLESMRDASFGDPLLPESGGQTLFRDMFDQQVATDIASGPGIGVADMIVRQLGGEPVTPQPVAMRPTGTVQYATKWHSPNAFVKDVLPFAKKAAQELGVSPLAIVAQAALETGWGQRVMPDAEGGNSLNLFGIKASGNWTGSQVSQPTLEFTAGAMQKRKQSFRAYPSLGAAFDDYTRFLADKPRYANVTGHANDINGFASALQAAGYATDPQYAQKIDQVATSETMRDALASLKEYDLASLTGRVE